MRLSKPQLLDTIIAAIRASGWEVVPLDTPPDHPFRLGVFTANESLNLRVYIWNLTHGGKGRAENEYRIQITGVPQGVTGEPGFKTLILGYWADGEVFAAFDFERHHGPIGYSPSIQIGLEALEAAYVDGFAPYNKGGGELAIAFRPDYFVEYCRQVEELRSLADSDADINALAEIAEEDTAINEAAVHLARVERRSVIRKVAEGNLAVRFRRRVLTAYSRRCAFCGMQMELVEAAHIVPASHPATSYQTANGIALCALHHLAFDHALVGFNPEYGIILNEPAIARLRADHLAGGEDLLRNSLRRMIHLPPAAADRPARNLVELGLRLRRWPEE